MTAESRAGTEAKKITPHTIYRQLGRIARQEKAAIQQARTDAQRARQELLAGTVLNDERFADPVFLRESVESLYAALPRVQAEASAERPEGVRYSYDLDGIFRESYFAGGIVLAAAATGKSFVVDFPHAAWIGIGPETKLDEVEAERKQKELQDLALRH